MPQTRRRFITTTIGTAAFGYACLREDGLARVKAAVAQAGGRSAADLATDEDFWFDIQRAYEVDRSIINLNNGGVAPAPAGVLTAMAGHVALHNHAPSRHVLGGPKQEIEAVRARLARHFGCDPEELALTRNASESLEICLYGLDLKPGDEILATSHDYPRMLNTIKQREQRDGIKLVTFPFPTPPESPRQLADLFAQNVTERTRAILMCHITNLTGQIFPVRDVVRMARARGIPVIVDGAHAFGHFSFKRDDLDCDYYGTSLHKWLSAPIGTGFLYVRKSKIADLWPMMAAPEPKAADIRKFEEIGTHPLAPRLAIAEAITFYEGLGPERKEARLRYLRDRHLNRLTDHPKVRCYTSRDPVQSCGIATIGVEGLDAGELSSKLWNDHRIIVTPIIHEHVNGIRVSPNVYTSLAEMDLFCEAMEKKVSG